MAPKPKPKPKCFSTPKTKPNITTPTPTPRTTPRTTNTRTKTRTITKTTTASPRVTAITMKKTPPPSKRKVTRHHACRFKPPCKQGHGGPAKSILPIGKYYYSEEALVRDLDALKRGAIYKDDKEFFKRVKAWYKAEVDRLIYRKQVQSEAKKEKEEKEIDKVMIRPAAATTRPGTSNLKRKLAAASNMNSDGSGSSDEPLISDDSVDNPSSESEYSDFDDSHFRKIRALRATTPITKNPHQTLQTPPPSSSEKPTPTRVQPSRAVKRKVDTTPSLLPLTPAKTPSPKRRKMTPVVERPKSEPNAEHRESPRPEDQTKGDYTLSKHDFEEYQPDYADRGSHADGLDVAYFMIEVEKAVDVAINELVAARLGNGVFSLSSPSEIDQGGIRARWRRLGIIASHTNVVGHKNRTAEEESKDEEEVFVPAGDAVSGEDRRPLALSRSAPPEVNKGGKKGLELRLVSRQGTPAPEAPMELSPTLGRWQLAGDRRGSGSSRLGGSRAGDRVKMKREVDSKAVAAEKESGLGSGGEGAVVGSPMESNKRSIQVSGLKFDVELRTLEVGEYGESKKTIWFHML